MRMTISPAELEALFKRVDEELAAENTPLNVRSILAAGKVGAALGISLPLVSPGTPEAARIPNAWISARLYEWYEEQYGEAQKRKMDVGAIALRIRGALWKGGIRMIFGEIVIYIDRQPDPHAGQGMAKRGNVLDDVDRLPQGLRDRLTDAELDEIFSLFKLGYDAYYCLDGARDNALVVAARADHAAAVDHLVKHNHYGQSKYSSLQAAEKTLKAVIAKGGGEFPRQGHPIRKLAALAEEHGLAKVPEEVVAAVQCGAGPRYGEEEVSLEEALAAHHAALEVARLARPIL